MRCGERTEKATFRDWVGIGWWLPVRGIALPVNLTLRQLVNVTRKIVCARDWHRMV